MTAQTEIILLTGFLGAGKTTLLNRLLKSPYLENTGFIINEFGAAGIDNQLVETADESMVELMSGCLCCTIKGDLPDTVAALLEKSRAAAAPLKRIAIETTGLADPAPIMQTLMGTPFLQGAVHLSAVLTVLDAAAGESNLRRFAEARRQAIFADRIIISKADLAGADAARNLAEAARELNRTAEILMPPVAGGSAEAEREFCRACLAPPAPTESRAGDLSGAEDAPHEHHHGCHVHAHDEGGEAGHKHEAHHRGHGAHSHDINRHSETIRSFTLTANEPLPLLAAEQFAYLLCQNYGQKILRFKGFIRTDRAGTEYLFQGLQGQFYEPRLFTRRTAARTAAKPALSDSDEKRSRLKNTVSEAEGEVSAGSMPSRWTEGSAPRGFSGGDTALPKIRRKPGGYAADSAPPPSQIVIIADGVSEAEIRRLFDACRNAPSPDTADRAALADSPLSIPGMKF